MRLVRPAVVFLLLTSLFPDGAQAQTAPASAEATTAEVAPAMSPQRQRAYDVAMARISQSLSHDEVAQLNLLAHAAAASGLCDALALDEGAVYAALTGSQTDALSEASEEEAQGHKDFMLIAFGILTGLMLDGATEDEAGFCAEAASFATEPDVTSYLKPVDMPKN